MFARILPAALILLMAGCARDRIAEIDDEVRSIVPALESPEWKTRCDAERRLLDLGPDAGPSVERARHEAKSDEARRRLDYVLARSIPLQWFPNFRDALDEARRTGKPILHVDAAGPPEVPWSVGDAEFCRVALADRDLRRELARDFVLVWPAGQHPWATATHVPGPMPDPDRCRGTVPEAGGETFLAVATPAGEVRHLIPGSLRPDRMRAELVRARTLLAAPTTEEAGRLRAETAEALEREAGPNTSGHDITVCRVPDCTLRRLRGFYVQIGRFGKPLLEDPTENPFREPEK